MTGEKILEVCARYRSRLRVELAKPRTAVAYADDAPENALAHAYAMLPQIEEMVMDERDRLGQLGSMAKPDYDKAFRWLGFVQGVLWCNQVYTIEELKEHNRPREEQDARGQSR